MITCHSWYETITSCFAFAMWPVWNKKQQRLYAYVSLYASVISYAYVNFCIWFWQLEYKFTRKEKRALVVVTLKRRGYDNSKLNKYDLEFLLNSNHEY